MKCKVCEQEIDRDSDDIFQCYYCQEYFHKDCSKTGSYPDHPVCDECRDENPEYLKCLIKEAKHLILHRYCVTCRWQNTNQCTKDCDYKSWLLDIEEIEL